MSKKLQPKFNKEFPKDAIKYFSPDYDEEIRHDNPKSYRLFQLISITCLVAPMFIYILAIIIFPAPNSPLLLLGLLGSFIIGLGFFNISAAWVQQYLGHVTTILFFLFGITLVIVSCVLLYGR